MGYIPRVKTHSASNEDCPLLPLSSVVFHFRADNRCSAALTSVAIDFRANRSGASTNFLCIGPPLCSRIVSFRYLRGQRRRLFARTPMTLVVKYSQRILCRGISDIGKSKLNKNLIRKRGFDSVFCEYFRPFVYIYYAYLSSVYIFAFCIS